MTALLIIVAVATLAGVGFFALKTIRGVRKLVRLDASAAALQSRLDNPEMDEGFAAQVSRARERGA